MNIRRQSYRFVQIGIASALVAAAGAAFSAEPSASSSTMPSKEMREQMAVVHEQIAACLRSDKSIAECRTEMMQKCQETMGQEGCQGMGMGKGMGMGMGMGMGNMGMQNGMRKPSQPSQTNK